MSHQRIVSIMERNRIDNARFDHFDYVETIEQLSELELMGHPKKRKLVEQFAEKCLDKIKKEEEIGDKNEKMNNFLSRMQMYESIRQEKLEAMRFINEKYDSNTKQLRFYPKTNASKATQKGRYWKDEDGLDAIEREESIHMPNSSIFADAYTQAR